MTSMDGDGTEMEEERLNEMIRQTLASSRITPAPPLDAMWDAIERRAFGETARRVLPVRTPARWSRWTAPALAAAAMLIGVGLGWSIAPRGSVATRVVTLPASVTASVATGDEAITPPAKNDAPVTGNPIRTASVATKSSTPDVKRVNALADLPAKSSAASPTARLASNVDDIGGSDMSRYLFHTAALLASLPSDRTVATTDTSIASRAGNLLTQTHLLLDSRAGSDPTLHKLLEDLELVLAQVALQRSNADLQLIHQAITVRDVLPRVHDAAVEASITD